MEVWKQEEERKLFLNEKESGSHFSWSSSIVLSHGVCVYAYTCM